MTNDSFRQAVDSRLSSVQMSPELKAGIRRQAAINAAQTTRQKAPITFKRIAAAGLAAAMTLAFGITVMAAVVPSFERLLFTLGDVRQLLQPVNLESESDGIRMEVVAAINDGETAYVYLDMQDIEDRGRISPNTKLLNVDFGNEEFIRAEQIVFDEETGIATFRLMWDDAFTEISGKRISLQVNGLLEEDEWAFDIDTGYTLADIMALSPNPEITYTDAFTNSMIQYGEDETLALEFESMIEDATLPLLTPNNLPEVLDNVSWIPITSAGVVDGLLHLQTSNDDFMARFNAPSLYFAYPGSDDNALTIAKTSHNVVDNTYWFEQYEFEEWVLEIPQGVEPEDIRIMAGGIQVSEYRETSWQLTFTLDEEVEVVEWMCGIDLGGWKIKRLELSPIGLTAFGYGEMGEDDMWLEMEAVLYDGTVVESDSSSVSVQFTGEIVSKIGFKGLVDPHDIEKIIINGQEFSVQAAYDREEAA